MRLRPHSPEWYDRLATIQDGYYYPWGATLAPWNGEDTYLDLVRQHLRPELNVLDVACGHGEVALSLAPHCRSVLGYDRVARWIERAQQTAQAQGLTNATFVCHDSSTAANGGQPRLPGGEAAFDLLICRRGPFHWMEDARRVARPGAVLLMLVPDARPSPPWNDWLPEPLRLQPAADPHWARPSIEQRLAVGGLTLHSWWSFEVPEWFAAPTQLYDFLAWGWTAEEAPPFAEMQPILERVFAGYGSPQGVELRHLRYLWKAIVPG
ncbi:MAG: class I SAM-dependent methyltransferase [Caldilinea sp. CFX5]|nr:class I SAM-dependent methyltransferase [Caldilinea sp. CFX5]